MVNIIFWPQKKPSGKREWFLVSDDQEILLGEYLHIDCLTVIDNQIVITIPEGDHQKTIFIDVSKKTSRPKLDLLNLVHNPDEQGIEAYLKREDEQGREKKAVEASRRVAELLNRVLQEVPEAILPTAAARRDRAPDILADRLIAKTFPDVYYEAQRRNPFFGQGLFDFLQPGGSDYRVPNPSDYLQPQNFSLMAGGGQEQLKDDREVMRFREPMHQLVVTGIFGRYQNGTWSRSSFPLRAKPLNPTHETTIILPNVKPGQDLALPKPLDAELIDERIRGIRGDTEQPLTADQNSLGEATIRQIPKVEQVAYSINVSDQSEPLKDISTKEYQSYHRSFTRLYGEDLQEKIANLPEEIDAFLTSDDFIKLEPKQKVIAIELFVRSIGYYDFDNDEVSQYKRGKSVEDKIMLSQMRLSELRSRHPEKSAEYHGKLFAGVCADFAEITCVILRRANFLAGVTSGFAPHGDTASIKNAHAAAFVLWPDTFNNNRAVIVDGTPSSGTDTRLEEISMPSLMQREHQAEAQIQEDVVQAEKEIDEMLAIYRKPRRRSYKKIR
jgi:hypothetical protein